MARDLIQDRVRDLHKRMGEPDLAHFHMLSREDFPDMQGLNTAEGQEFLLAKVNEIRPDAVFLDSRMCLLAGDMKDEEVWTDTLPLALELTRRQIAQIWLDHTGHLADHIYGSKTKEWQMDAVILLEEIEQAAADISVKLKFTKARRRRPENREDFDPVTITLRDDRWSWAPAEPTAPKPRKERDMQDGTDLLRRAVLHLLGEEGNASSVTMSILRTYLVSDGWFDANVDYSEDKQSETVRLTQKGHNRLGNALRTLKRRGILDFDRNTVWLP